jgi:hypothetical protein
MECLLNCVVCDATYANLSFKIILVNDIGLPVFTDSFCRNEQKLVVMCHTT